MVIGIGKHIKLQVYNTTQVKKLCNSLLKYLSKKFPACEVGRQYCFLGHHNIIHHIQGVLICADDEIIYPDDA